MHPGGVGQTGLRLLSATDLQLLREFLRQGLSRQAEQEPTAAGESQRAAILKLQRAHEAAATEGGDAAVYGQTSSGASALPEAVVWLPIPLSDNRQGWAQVSVRTERDGEGPDAVQQQPQEVRLWWETPELGTVDVTLTGAGEVLSVRFHVREAETLTRVKGSLPALRAGLQEAGFSRAAVTCRARRSGDEQGPVRSGGLSLDRRL